MDTPYAVTCDCGRTHRVSAGAAGMLLACDCGRQVQVPTLRALRREAGEPVASPEMEIRALLREGTLPQERECLSCGTPTADVGHAEVICERSEVSDTGWKWRLLPLLFGYLVFTRSGEARERGRDLAFRLPLRLCRDCAGRLRGAALVEVLRRVPVYARLIDKYPDADISLDRG